MKDDAQAKAVERMKGYIHSHMKDPISLKDLADSAGYSPWHSARLFKAYTGTTPFAYIRSKRMRYAAEVLEKGDARVIDVAFDFLFASHEGFTRAFVREFGMSPKAYAIQAREKEKGMKEGIEQRLAIFVHVVKRDRRKLVVKRGREAEHYFSYCKEVGCQVWDVLAGMKGALGEPMGIWLPQQFRPDHTSRYVQGVELPLDYQGKIPDGFDVMELPEMELMIFQGQPYDDENFESEIQDFWEVIQRYQPEVYGYRWDGDDAFRFQLEPQGYRGYIEGKAVKKI